MNSKITSTTMLSLILSIIASGWAAAQQPDPTKGPKGFFRLMDAVSVGTGKLEVSMDGTAVRADGFDLGDVTGGISRMPSAYSVKFKREGIESGTTRITLVKDETVTLIPFAEYVPATEKKAAHWKIQILRLMQHEPKERLTATFINVTRTPELQVDILQKSENWEPHWVKRLGLERAIIQKGSGYVSLRCGKKDLRALSVGTSGNFVAVIYEDAAGEIASKNFQDFKYLSVE